MYCLNKLKDDYLFTDFRYLEQTKQDVPWIRIVERKVSLIKTICKKLTRLNIKKLKDIDYAARNYITKKGLEKHFGHGLGHGIGLAVHECPTIN